MQEDRIQTLAREAGLDLAGVARVEPPAGLKEKLRARQRENRITPFEVQSIEQRLNPDRALTGCRSMIVIALSYLTAADPEPWGQGPRGMVAHCARGLDYHLLLKERAGKMIEFLRREFPATTRFRFLCDSSPLVERAVARQAGIGWIGENCTLTTPAHGSFVALGTILLDRELEPATPEPENCRHCGRCRAACPTGALLEPYRLDPFRCLSYLTQAAGIVPAAYRPLLGTRLYGCDRCQEVCPHNRAGRNLPQNASAKIAARDCPAPVLSFPFFPASTPLLPLLQISRKEFEHTIGYTAAGWRGKTVIQRNAVIALGNSGHCESVPDLARVLREDPRPVIRLHAAWSLGALGGNRARYYLEHCLRYEQDPAVLGEARGALEKMV